MGSPDNIAFFKEQRDIYLAHLEPLDKEKEFKDEYLTILELAQQNIELMEKSKGEIIKTCADAKNDHELRQSYVGTQMVFELWLAQQARIGNVEKALAIVHTPGPSTPTRLSKNCDNIAEVVKPELLKETSILTVTGRRIAITELLDAGVHIIAAYSNQKQHLKNEEYEKLAENENFTDWQLDFDSQAIQNNGVIGATYIVKFKEQEKPMYFSIRFRQIDEANTPPAQDITHGLWLGDSQPVLKRKDEVSSYLKTIGLDIEKFFNDDVKSIKSLDHSAVSASTAVRVCPQEEAERQIHPISF